jgi:UDP-glucose 4-epimerase
MKSPSQRIVAVTGASGLIGTRLVPMLRSAGAEVRLLLRSSAPPLLDAVTILGDLTDAASLRELVRGASEVVHLGGVAHTTLRTEAERLVAKEINVGGTCKLLEAAREVGVGRILITSSAHVYAGQAGIGLNEVSPTAGDSFYAQMKLESEAAARDAVSSGMDVVVIRPCIVYGPDVRFNLNSLMRAIRRGYYFHAAGLDPLRSFASVDTVAAAIVHLLASGEKGATYNIADRQSVHLVGWVNGLADRMGVRRPRALPMGLLRTAAAILTPAARVGLPAPLTKELLAKLTASFSLDVTALERTGFAWPQTSDRVLDEMVTAATAHQD